MYIIIKVIKISTSQILRGDTTINNEQLSLKNRHLIYENSNHIRGIYAIIMYVYAYVLTGNAKVRWTYQNAHSIK